MAGVRSDEEPIAKPRGLPADLSEVTLLHWKLDAGHSASWLGQQEIGVLRERFQKLSPDEDLEYHVLHTYLFSHSLDFLHVYPDSFKRERKEGLEDVRLVFWFDC